MKKNLKIRYIVPAVLSLSLLLVSGCASLVESIGAIDSAVSQTKARAGQAVMDAAGIGAMEDALVASMVYSQVFFAGGYMTGYGDIEEGQGVIWKVTSTDEAGSESMENERALLKRTADGNEWWLLKYSVEGGEPFVGEALLDGDYGIVKFRYRDTETNQIREWTAENDEESAEEESREKEEVEDTVYAGNEAMFRGDYQEYVVGKEKIAVDFGTYTAEHVKIEDSYTSYSGDEGSGDNAETYEVSYEWWIADDVPGNLLKFEWNNISEGFVLKGELLSVKSGYTTELESF